MFLPASFRWWWSCDFCPCGQCCQWANLLIVAGGWCENVHECGDLLFSWPRPGLEAIAGRFIQLIKLLLGAGLIFFEYLQRDSVILKLKERCKQLTNTLINLFLPKAWNQKERDNLFFPVQLQKFNLINLIKTISTISENESSWRSLDTIYTVTEIHFFLVIVVELENPDKPYEKCENERNELSKMRFEVYFVVTILNWECKVCLHWTGGWWGGPGNVWKRNLSKRSSPNDVSLLLFWKYQ